jgi:hypothetical protein
MNRLTALVVACLLSTTLASAEPIKFARYPHVSQGKLLDRERERIESAAPHGTCRA